MPSTTRGSLPPGVYWRRRLAVLSLGLVLVLVIGRVLHLSSDGKSGPGVAQDTGATTGGSPSTTPAHPHHSGTGKVKHPSSHSSSPTSLPSSSSPPPLATPTGPCADSDVHVTPTVPLPVGGSDVAVVLNFQTGTTEACTWRVSAKTVTVRITEGVDDVWSSRQCPRVVPTQDIVVRRVVATPVTVVWNAKRSDAYCSDRTAWALPGTYHVAAAVFGGEPTDVAFELVSPVAPTVTETASPQEQATGNGNGNGSGKGNGKGKPGAGKSSSH